LSSYVLILAVVCGCLLSVSTAQRDTPGNLPDANIHIGFLIICFTHSETSVLDRCRYFIFVACFNRSQSCHSVWLYGITKSISGTLPFPRRFMVRSKFTALVGPIGPKIRKRCADSGGIAQKQGLGFTCMI